MASGTFLGVNHYRFYELDHSDHIEASYSVECGRADAVRAVGRLMGQGPAAGVEVWQGVGRISRLRRGVWQRLRCRWIDRSHSRPGRAATDPD